MAASYSRGWSYGRIRNIMPISYSEPLTSETNITPRPQKISRFTWGVILFAAATTLFISQLIVGTSLYFSVGVYVSLVSAIITLQIIRFSSIAGILISACVIRFLVVSQILKTGYGQPGDSNLLVPDTTISIITIGVLSICLAGIFVHQIQGNNIFIKIKSIPGILSNSRDISFVIGVFCFVISLLTGQTETGEVAHGGIVGLAHQFGNIGYFAVLAETWLVLTRSEGRRSTSLYLYIIMGVLMAFGIADARKATIVQCIVTYYVGCFSYRKLITRRQIFFGIFIGLFGVLFVYPFVNLSRSGILITGSRISSVMEMANRLIDDPSEFYKLWDIENSRPMLDLDRMTQGLYYLGFDDALLERVILIANTDIIASAVDQDGLFGMTGVTDGFKSLLPTFLAPEKPRFSHGDQVTWFYGLRSPNIVGYPTLGFFASCYATLGWVGVLIIPFLIMVPLFILIQLSGSSIYYNILGVYLIMGNILDFGEMGVDGGIIKVFRNLPLDIISILIIYYLANVLFVRKLSFSTRNNVAVDQPK